MKAYQKIFDFSQNVLEFYFNRYRRGLETCPKAKTSKSGHAIFFSFFRRVRGTSMTQRRVKNARVHFWTFSPVSVKSRIKILFFLPVCGFVFSFLNYLFLKFRPIQTLVQPKGVRCYLFR